jgi:hypothetical protein
VRFFLQGNGSICPEPVTLPLTGGSSPPAAVKSTPRHLPTGGWGLDRRGRFESVNLCLRDVFLVINFINFKIKSIQSYLLKLFIVIGYIYIYL